MQEKKEPPQKEANVTEMQDRIHQTVNYSWNSWTEKVKNEMLMAKSSLGRQLIPLPCKLTGF